MIKKLTDLFSKDKELFGLRNIEKMHDINDGTRSLFESTVSTEVIEALRDWVKNTKDVHSTLIGGLGLSFHAIPRMTQDIDVLLLSENDIPNFVETFKKIRKHAFRHIKTHVEVEVLTPDFLRIPEKLVQEIIDTSILNNGIRIASVAGIIASKLNRLSFQDKADIISLIKIDQSVNLDGYSLPNDKLKEFELLKEIAKTDKHGRDSLPDDEL